MTQHTSIEAIVRSIVREELVSAGLVPAPLAPPLPAPPALAPLVAGWASLCLAGDAMALTAHEAVARLYPPPAYPDRWDDLRAAIERYAPPKEPGAAPAPALLGEALRRMVRGVPVRTEPGGPLVRLDHARMADGRPSKSGGRARWCVAPVPAYVPGSAAVARAALVERLRAEEAERP